MISLFLGFLWGGVTVWAYYGLRPRGTYVLVVTGDDEEGEDAPLQPHEPRDALAITCRACDAPPGIGCADLSTGADRVGFHLIRLQDINGRQP